MLPYEVLRGQWLLGALGGGLVLLLTAVASYLAIWQPRPGKPLEPSQGSAGDESRPPTMTFLQSLPVVLLLTYVGIVIFMVVYFAEKIASPPNW